MRLAHLSYYNSVPLFLQDFLRSSCKLLRGLTAFKMRIYTEKNRALHLERSVMKLYHSTR